MNSCKWTMQRFISDTPFNYTANDTDSLNPLLECSSDGRIVLMVFSDLSTCCPLVWCSSSDHLLAFLIVQCSCWNLVYIYWNLNMCNYTCSDFRISFNDICLVPVSQKFLLNIFVVSISSVLFVCTSYVEPVLRPWRAFEECCICLQYIFLNSSHVCYI